MRSAPSNSRDALILLVDDNQDGILARRMVLEEVGYRVATANSGPEALERVEAENFDLVVTDFKMHPMDGLQLISELRNRKFTNPIILLSGFAEVIGLKPDTTGADAVVQKSANEITTLVRCANRLLNPKKPPQKANPVIRKRRSV